MNTYKLEHTDLSYITAFYLSGLFFIANAHTQLKGQITQSTHYNSFFPSVCFFCVFDIREMIALERKGPR